MTQSAPANWRSVSQANRAVSKFKTRSSSSAVRSKSQRKNKPLLSTFEQGVAKARLYVDNATPEHLETQLQKLLKDKQYLDAAFLIAASPYLNARFQTSDVARLMLEQAKSLIALEQVAQLVRDLQLQRNDALVTLLINEMVRALHFGAAVRLAQEMVPAFGQHAAPATTTKRPCWTPKALIQAMLRAKKFRAALKYSKQFGLLEAFPAPHLVAGMLETRCWEEAISSVMEMQLFKEYPLEVLAVEMIKQRQWSQAAKCMNKMSDEDETKAKFYEALVLETAHVGDFVTSLRYLREFKLDQGSEDRTVSLLRYLVDLMLAHGEFYKAIKYAIKFKLAKNPLNDAIAAAEAALAAANGEEARPLKKDDHIEYLSQYNVEILIRKAIDGGQLHVATTYIKRLRLREKFAEELVAIEKAQQNWLLEFRQYAQLRLAQFQDSVLQQNLRDLLGDQADDEMVDLEPVEKDIVLSEEEEIVSQDEKAQQVEDKEDKSKLTEKPCEALSFSESNGIGETKQRESNTFAATSVESRFGFARATLTPPPSLPSGLVSVVGVSCLAGDSQPCTKSLSPTKPAPPPGLFNSSEAEPVQADKPDSADSFNFANFAKSFQVNGPAPPSPASSSLPPQQLSLPQLPQQSFLSQQQQVKAIFGRPMSNGQYASGSPGHSMPSMMPPQKEMYHPQGNMPLDAMQPRGYLQPLPPPPLPRPSNNRGGAVDVAALAMQFHKGSGSNGLSGFSGYAGPQPPLGDLCAAPSGQQQQFSPGMPPLPFGAPPPQSAFKPSMSYTSVTTTRQKK
ncbi:unnamed protein product [Peronospora belbahrii]|uniref:Uncharacterized protein n=1 Tax=Peronospora belbahrii TaxID=622444 RepID=A0ABN8CL35_9STRA|nr:unnamed protein product [Peronospora belbahrii]